MSEMKIKRLINGVEKSYILYRKYCVKIAIEAQKYIDWDSDIGCEYFPSDGVCLTTTDAYVCPAASFFGVIKEKGKISQSEFKSICV